MILGDTPNNLVMYSFLAVFAVFLLVK